MVEVDVDAKYSHFKQEVGNCLFTDNNFVKAMFSEDCLAVPFKIYRPKAAIADPGRIRVKAVYHLVVSTAEYMYNAQARRSVEIVTAGDAAPTYFDTVLGIKWKVEDNKVKYFSDPGNANEVQ